ncbi:hypothetical protein ACROYT_G015077 [Oculina patagonica]
MEEILWESPPIDYSLPLEVIFTGDTIEDYGSPRREVLGMALREIRDQLFKGEDDRHPPGNMNEAKREKEKEQESTILQQQRAEDVPGSNSSNKGTDSCRKTQILCHDVPTYRHRTYTTPTVTSLSSDRPRYHAAAQTQSSGKACVGIPQGTSKENVQEIFEELTKQIKNEIDI